MIFTPEVIAALQILKDNAENDFELHRISVLENDLTSPPKVEVIDENHQKFDGIIYRRNAKGYFMSFRQLHRAVWAYYHEHMPSFEQHEVHHVDLKPQNNNPENLQCLTREEHQRVHSKQQKICAEKICDVCGKTFVGYYKQDKFCSHKCANIAHKQSEKMQEDRVCCICGKNFKVYKHSPQKYCSRECRCEAVKMKQHTNSMITKTCPVCGKNFTNYIRLNRTYCSSKCATIARTEVITKICPTCGKTFTSPPKRKSQKYCCPACSHKAATGHIKPPKKCAWCGREFYAKNRAQKCCSISCGSYFRTKQKK